MLDLMEQRMRRRQPCCRCLRRRVEFNFKRNYHLINHAPETAFAVGVMQNRQDDHVDAAVRPTWAPKTLRSCCGSNRAVMSFLGNGDGGHQDAGHGRPHNLHNPATTSTTTCCRLAPRTGLSWHRPRYRGLSFQVPALQWVDLEAVRPVNSGCEFVGHLLAGADGSGPCLHPSISRCRSA
jgi:hypothetical protein